MYATVSICGVRLMYTSCLYVRYLPLCPLYLRYADISLSGYRLVVKHILYRKTRSKSVLPLQIISISQEAFSRGDAPSPRMQFHKSTIGYLETLNPTYLNQTRYYRP